jgi:hypothetical protein
VQLIGGLSACFDGRSASRLEYPQHLDGTVASFGLGGRRASLHRTRGCLGINRIGLSAPAAVLTLRVLHFQDLDPTTA